MNDAQAATNAPHVSIRTAADTLGISIWDVDRLIKTGDLRTVTLIDADSLAALQEQQ